MRREQLHHLTTMIRCEVLNDHKRRSTGWRAPPRKSYAAPPGHPLTPRAPPRRSTPPARVSPSKQLRLVSALSSPPSYEQRWILVFDEMRHAASAEPQPLICPSLPASQTIHSPIPAWVRPNVPTLPLQIHRLTGFTGIQLLLMMISVLTEKAPLIPFGRPERHAHLPVNGITFNEFLTAFASCLINAVGQNSLTVGIVI